MFFSSMNRAMTCQPAATSVATRAITTTARISGVENSEERARQRKRPVIPIHREFHNTIVPQANDDDKKKTAENTSSSSTSNTSSSSTAATPSMANMGMKDKFKHLWKQYGVIAIGTYFGIYFSTIGGMYLALDYDIFSSSTFGLDPAYAIEKFCHIYERFTNDNTLPAYIREHPAGKSHLVL
jgi:hypothetical protein